MKAVYCVGILDFTFDDYENEPERSEVVHTIKLKNQHNKIFYDKLTFIYLEIPNFKQTESEIGTGRHSIRLDKWLYFIKHLEDFQNISEIFKDEVFSQAFAKAELAKFGQTELASYENSLKTYRDLKGVIDTAFDEGKLEKSIEMAKIMKGENKPMEKIIKYAGLTKEEIEKL